MGRIYRFLGMTVGIIVHDLDDQERQANYAADITYGTNNEYGFDYLRDNMKFRLEDCVQRGHNFAIVDEVDSILVDEARTPLIISGPSEESTDKYYKINRIIPKLTARRRDQGQGAGRKLHHRRLHRRRKASQRGAHRRRHRESGEAAGLRQSLSARELVHAASRPAGAARRWSSSSATRIIWCRTAR